jgi:hypothetical protein
MATPKLLLVPNRYKSGLLISEFPESGAGDFDVVRATTATRVNASGLLESVASGVPRLDFGVSGCPVLLVEASGTNLLQYSNDFSNAAWVGGVVYNGSAQSPTQTPNQGQQVADNNPAAFLSGTQFRAKTENTNTNSVWVLKTTGTPSHYPMLGIGYATGGAVNNNGYFILDTTNGTGNFAADVGVITNPILRVEDLGDFWRFEFTATDTSGTQTQVVFEFFPAASLNGTTLTPSATGSQVIYNCQSESGAFATSDIPTTAAAATRNADVMTVEPPVGTTLITTTFEDGSNEEITPSGTYTIPNGRIKSIVMT